MRDCMIECLYVCEVLVFEFRMFPSAYACVGMNTCVYSCSSAHVRVCNLNKGRFLNSEKKLNFSHNKPKKLLQ